MNQIINISYIFLLTLFLSEGNIFSWFPAILPKLVDERRVSRRKFFARKMWTSILRTRTRASSRLRRDYLSCRWHRSLGVSVFLRRKERRSQWLQVIFFACENIPTASLQLVTPSSPPLSRILNSVLFVDDSSPFHPSFLSFFLRSIYSERKVL